MINLGLLRVRRIDRVISTDDIIPGRYKHMFTDPSELAKHVFENIFPGLAGTFRQGDVICTTATFGIGSSREQAVSSLLAAGVKAVISPGFGRIFFRNAWNLGLIAIEAANLHAAEGDTISIDLEAGGITGASQTVVSFAPPSERMLEMVAEGGLLPLVVKRLAQAGAQHEGRRP